MTKSEEQQLKLLRDFNLSAHNSFGLQVKAHLFVSVTTVTELKLALNMAQEQGLPFFILGGGSNVLFVDDDFPGVVIHIAIMGIKVLEKVGDDVFVAAAAGENWHELVGYCMDSGFHGLENLALIPGNVGAAPVQNIGAYGVELKDFLVELTVLMVDSGEIVRMNSTECHLAYRDSIFKQQLKHKAVVLEVLLKLTTAAVVNIEYGSLKLAFLGKRQPTGPADVFAAVCAIRRSRLPDPAVLGNAGSFFKNPLVALQDYEALRTKFPTIPSFPAESIADAGGGDDVQTVKVPAAWLIEQTGWKGFRKNDAGIYQEQPLVLVNHGGAEGRQLLDLALAVRDSVYNKFAIALETEVQIIKALD